MFFLFFRLDYVLLFRCQIFLLSIYSRYPVLLYNYCIFLDSYVVFLSVQTNFSLCICVPTPLAGILHPSCNTLFLYNILLGVHTLDLFYSLLIFLFLLLISNLKYICVSTISLFVSISVIGWPIILPFLIILWYYYYFYPF